MQFSTCCQRIALLFWCTVLGTSAKGELPQVVIEKIKKATVLVMVNNKQGQASGSGFFVTPEIIATNAHVLGIANAWRILKGEATVVLQSGSSAERSLGAQLAGVDIGRDIAFLRVPAQPGIDPLDFVDSQRVTETLPIYVVGFPLGNALDLTARNAAVSFSVGRVSSLRRNEYGDLSSIQVDASLVFGNSGGPIVNAEGQVVAMSVATIVGTNVGFAIPADHIREDLDGRICDLALTSFGLSLEDDVLDAKLRIIDPLRKVSNIAVYHWRGPTQQSPDLESKIEVAGQQAKPETGKSHTQLTRRETDDIWEGRLKLSLSDGMDLWVQPAIEVDGKVRVTDAINYSRDVRNKKNEKPHVESKRELTIADQISARKVGRGGSAPIIPKVAPTLFSLPNENQSKENLNEVIDLGSISKYVKIAEKEPLQLVVDPLGERIYGIFDEESFVRVYSTDDFSPQQKIKVAFFPRSIWCDEKVIVVACGESRIIQYIDRATLQVRHSARIKNRGLEPERIVGRAPDGSLTTIWKSADDSRHVILVDEELPELELFEGDIDWLAFSGGEKFVWVQSNFEGRGGRASQWRLDEKPTLAAPKFSYRGEILRGFSGLGHAFVSRDQSRFLLPLQFRLTSMPNSETATLCFDISSLIPKFQMPGYVIAEHPTGNNYISWDIPKNGLLTVYFLDKETGAVVRRVQSEIKDLHVLTFHIPPVAQHACYIAGRELFMLYHRRSPGGIHVIPCSLPPTASVSNPRQTLSDGIK